MNYKQTFPTPTERSAGTNTRKYIVLHHTATGEGTINGVLNGLNKRYDYASCHYCVDTNGDIYKMGKDTDILWHAGVSSWGGLTDLNKHSIGIEVIGPLSDGGFTDAQRSSVAELLRHLCATHGLESKHIVRHKDIAPKRKIDIADTFWSVVSPSWEEWKETVFTPQSDVADWAVESFKKAEQYGYSQKDATTPIDPVRLRHIFVKHPRYKAHITDNGKPLTYQEIIKMFDKAGDL